MNITGKIDVKKIVKGKLYVGERGTYLDIVLIETPNNQYGNDFMIVQSTEKDEDSIILGNAKYFKKREESKTQSDEPEPIDSDLPF